MSIAIQPFGSGGKEETVPRKLVTNTTMDEIEKDIMTLNATGYLDKFIFTYPAYGNRYLTATKVKIYVNNELRATIGAMGRSQNAWSTDNPRLVIASKDEVDLFYTVSTHKFRGFSYVDQNGSIQGLRANNYDAYDNDSVQNTIKFSRTIDLNIERITTNTQYLEATNDCSLFMDSSVQTFLCGYPESKASNCIDLIMLECPLKFDSLRIALELGTTPDDSTLKARGWLFYREVV